MLNSHIRSRSAPDDGRHESLSLDQSGEDTKNANDNKSKKRKRVNIRQGQAVSQKRKYAKRITEKEEGNIPHCRSQTVILAVVHHHHHPDLEKMKWIPVRVLENVSMLLCCFSERTIL